MEPKYLLPNKIRWIGFLLLFVVLSIILIKVIFNVGYDFLKVNVFALVTENFFGMEFFKVQKQNLIYPLILIMSILGVTFLATSKEKIEKNQYSGIRADSIMLTYHIILGILVFSFIFIYEFALLYLIILFLFVPQLIYFIIFQIKRKKFDKTDNQ